MRICGDISPVRTRARADNTRNHGRRRNPTPNFDHRPRNPAWGHGSSASGPGFQNDATTESALLDQFMAAGNLLQRQLVRYAVFKTLSAQRFVNIGNSLRLGSFRHRINNDHPDG